MDKISIKLTPQLAEAYSKGGKEEHEKVEKILQEVLEILFRKKAVSGFQEARRALSQEALENGLTPEILEKLLHEED
ncbi:hypothetical protein BH24BAC1_BH24BAC1_39200 [soil metagenome]